MPDNKDASDTAANTGANGEQSSTATADQTTAASGSAGNGAEYSQTVSEPNVTSHDSDSGEFERDPHSGQNDNSDAAMSSNDIHDDSDPMGFGDKRMGDDVEPLDELEQLRVRLADAESKAAEHWDRLLRLQAEMENQRKRAQNDVTKARKFALEGIVGDLLPVKDSLEMGLAAAQAEDGDPQSIVQGAELTLKMLSQVFEKNNIIEVNPVDEKFDPEFHQAMSMQEVEGKAANTVAAVMQKGYTLNDRLVRPALVMVAK